MRVASDFWASKTTWLVFMTLAIDVTALLEGHATPKEAAVLALAALALLCLRDTAVRKLEEAFLELRLMGEEEHRRRAATLDKCTDKFIEQVAPPFLGVAKSLEISRAVLGGAERLLDEAAALSVARQWAPRD